MSCNITTATLVRYGLNKWMKWMENQLDSHTNCVLISNTKSSWQPVAIVMPQISKVGLYPLYNIIQFSFTSLLTSSRMGQSAHSAVTWMAMHGQYAGRQGWSSEGPQVMQGKKQLNALETEQRQMQSHWTMYLTSKYLQGWRLHRSLGKLPVPLLQQFHRSGSWCWYRASSWSPLPLVLLLGTTGSILSAPYFQVLPYSIRSPWTLSSLG